MKKRYLIQIKGYRSSDSSHRVARWTIEANNLDELNDQLAIDCNQHEVEILASEDIPIDWTEGAS